MAHRTKQLTSISWRSLTHTRPTLDEADTWPGMVSCMANTPLFSRLTDPAYCPAAPLPHPLGGRHLRRDSRTPGLGASQDGLELPVSPVRRLGQQRPGQTVGGNHRPGLQGDGVGGMAALEPGQLVVQLVPQLPQQEGEQLVAVGPALVDIVAGVPAQTAAQRQLKGHGLIPGNGVELFPKGLPPPSGGGHHCLPQPEAVGIDEVPHPGQPIRVYPAGPPEGPPPPPR